MNAQGPKVRAKADKIIRHLEIEKEWKRPYFDKFQGHGKLHEIRIKCFGNEYRLIGCFGPQQKDFTILIGAIEKNHGKYEPRSVLEIAEERITLIEDKRYTDEY
ncbi:MAG: type II toxin-antitoxin system RelE/ParE family toxin [Deltaproteobacteria bacterium]|nr:type II toxin-antitoxin system RelE/ParE family toxin [Deltaproteobacteria bacterium]